TSAGVPDSSPALDLFLDLAAISSPPGGERPAADRVVASLRALGLDGDEDAAGPSIDATAGNLLCWLEPTAEGGTPVFLCAHLDTVPPSGPIEPVVEDGFVRNAAGRIPGAAQQA